MKRLALSLLGSLSLLGAYQAPARAQTTTTTTGAAFDPNFDAEIDDEPVERGAFAYVRANQCTPSVQFKFKVQNYNTPVTVLEVWASTTGDCNSAANRATNNNNPSACWLIGSLSNVQGKAELTAPATAVFKNGSSDETGCPDNQAGTKYTIYFVPLDTPTSSNPASPPEANSNQKLKGIFTLYTKLPDAPSGVSGLSGESQVGLKWSTASGAVSTTEYRAYFDTSIGADSTCSGSALVSGEPAPEADDSIVFASSSQKALNAKLGGLDGKGVDINSYVAAAVVTKDIAGNESVLSNVVCIQRVETRSFLDECADDPGCRGGFEKCSVQMGGRKAGSAVLLIIAGLAAALGFRRRLV